MGENGAVELTAKGCGDALVALFFQLVRGLDKSQLSTLMAAVDKNPQAQADLVVMAYQTRATRGLGKGEKLLFYQMLAHLDESAVLATLDLVPLFGYWKDLLLLQEVEVSAKIKQKALELFAVQLKTDGAELAAAATEERTPKLSLAAKYAPREGSHFDKKGLGLAKALATRLFGAANEQAAKRKYRKSLSELNAALNTTEVLMAAGRYAEIEFSRVASLCLQRSRKAFLNEALKGKNMDDERGNRHPDDEDRVECRRKLREAVAKKAVKGKQLMPHEVASKCMSARRALSTLEGGV